MQGYELIYLVIYMALSLSKSQVDDFYSKNSYAMQMLMSAVPDYMAARCCLLYGLFSGLYLGSLAIEKTLKGIISIETKSKPRNIHNLVKLKDMLQKEKDYGLNEYTDFLNKLFGDYQARYHDNPDRSMGMSTDELHQLDDLWVYLINAFPAPDEIKYRSIFFAFLFEPQASLYANVMKQNNKALARELKSYGRKYKEVFIHVHPQINVPKYISDL